MQTDANIVENKNSLVFTEGAANKVKTLIEDEKNSEIVKCGVKLLVDPMSIQYLRGAEIDYQEGLEGAQFVIKNPNAKTTCGCGSSFST